MAFPFLYMTPAVDKLNGRGLSNTLYCECLLKKTKVTQYYVATEGLSGCTNNLEHFHYKREWVNAQ